MFVRSLTRVMPALAASVTVAACQLAIAGGGASSDRETANPFDAALESTESGAVVTAEWLEPAPLSIDTMPEYSGSAVETCGYETTDGAMFPVCPDCETAKCYRGVDHLGTLAHGTMGFVDPLHVCDRLACWGFPGCVFHAPVVLYHELLEDLYLCEEVWIDYIDNSYLGRVQRARAARSQSFCCAMQCEFVNWRLGSMYLEGCVPEGYNLWPFIETVNHAEFYSTPLFGNGPQEPGGSELEAALVDNTEAKPLSALSLNIAPPAGELPKDVAAERFELAGTRIQLPGTHRMWCGCSYYWNASLLNHQPLYFEDVNLERHGFTYGLCQPVVSGVRFFGTLPALPYLVVAQPPQTTRYTLGETRPGSHAQYVHEFPPLSLDASAIQAAAIVGTIFFIP